MHENVNSKKFRVDSCDWRERESTLYSTAKKNTWIRRWNDDDDDEWVRWSLSFFLFSQRERIDSHTSVDKRFRTQQTILSLCLECAVIPVVVSNNGLFDVYPSKICAVLCCAVLCWCSRVKNTLLTLELEKLLKHYHLGSIWMLGLGVTSWITSTIE